MVGTTGLVAKCTYICTINVALVVKANLFLT